MPRPLKKMGEGLWKSIWSALLGFALMSIISLFVKLSIFPDWTVTALGAVNLVSSLLMLRSMRQWAVLYAVGWLAGASIFLYFGLFDTLAIVLNIVAPIPILMLRFVVWVRRGARQAWG